MASTLARHVPWPLIPRNFPVPSNGVSVPCRLTLSRQVFGEISLVWVSEGDSHLTYTIDIALTTEFAITADDAR